MNEFNTFTELMVSCEDPETVYVCTKHNIRFIFREGRYIGWYQA